mmetsp:Transcript_43066/g.101379  ORF Transcript_43066/g.101379 Transcript_43066/m.101379 type:complete len:213 (+) Transcript_43066:161-799(+)
MGIASEKTENLEESFDVTRFNISCLEGVSRIVFVENHATQSLQVTSNAHQRHPIEMTRIERQRVGGERTIRLSSQTQRHLDVWLMEHCEMCISLPRSHLSNLVRVQLNETASEGLQLIRYVERPQIRQQTTRQLPLCLFCHRVFSLVSGDTLSLLFPRICNTPTLSLSHRHLCHSAPLFPCLLVRSVLPRLHRSATCCVCLVCLGHGKQQIL